MPTELKIPAVGESITEVQIGEWHKSEGDAVARDENLVTLESDKATVDLPAPAGGMLARILKRAGQTAGVGEVIAEIEEAVENPPPETAREHIANPPHAPGKSRSRESKPPPRSGETGQDAESKEKNGAANLPARKPASQAPSQTTESNGGHQPPAEPGNKMAPRGVVSPLTGADEEVAPMSALRRMAARRLVAAQHVAALLTTVNEIDMSAVIALRREFGESFQKSYGTKLGFMSFFVKAVVDGLKRVPQLNAQVRDTDVVYFKRYDIGVAIGGGKGLVVPVVRRAERLSFAEIEITIGDFARRAAENKLLPDELSGGTFTITNGGIYGSLLSTPIVNPPQSGILGMHAIQERPIAVAGNVVIRPMMYVALTYDHRIVDGREAVTFLKRVKDAVENPSRMLIEA